MGIVKGYTFNKDGSVIGKRDNILKPFAVGKNKSKKGYLAVRYYENGKARNLLVHRVLAELYIPNPNNLAQVNHINGDAWDNRIENLEWISASDNCKHRTLLHPEYYLEKMKLHTAVGFNR